VIGMTTPSLAAVPIRSDDELTERWAAMLEPPVFRARSLWLAWIDHDGLMLPVVLPVDDVPPVPDAGMLDGLRQLHLGIAQDRLSRGGRLAMALCRPGRPTVTRYDNAWVEGLREALDELPPGQTWSLHLAAGGRVLPIELPA
jgi:hypothetical protein